MQKRECWSFLLFTRSIESERTEAISDRKDVCHLTRVSCHVVQGGLELDM